MPRQIKENGLRPGEISSRRKRCAGIVRDYTREAGVRSLERQIGSSAAR